MICCEPGCAVVVAAPEVVFVVDGAVGIVGDGAVAALEGGVDWGCCSKFWSRWFRTTFCTV